MAVESLVLATVGFTGHFGASGWLPPYPPLPDVLSLYLLSLLLEKLRMGRCCRHPGRGTLLQGFFSWGAALRLGLNVRQFGS